MTSTPKSSAGGGEPQGRVFIVRRAVEFAVVFFGLPLLCALAFPPVLIIPMLAAAAGVCLVVLLRDRSFPRRRLWNAAAVRRDVARVLLVFVLGGAGMTAAVLLFEPPGSFLRFVRRAPRIWALVMVLYPLLSVYPQELVFRAFLFHRYRALFPRPWQTVGASAVCFAFAHIVFWNWVAVLLCLVGGVLFAWTYRRTKSLLMVAIEHALYGCFIFTVGLGSYFFHGTVEMARRLSG